MQDVEDVLPDFLNRVVTIEQPRKNPDRDDIEQMSEILDRFATLVEFAANDLAKWYDQGYRCSVHGLARAAIAGRMNNVRFLLSRGHFLHGRGLEVLYEQQQQTEEMIKYLTDKNNKALGMGAPFILAQQSREQSALGKITCLIRNMMSKLNGVYIH